MCICLLFMRFFVKEKNRPKKRGFSEPKNRPKKLTENRPKKRHKKTAPQLTRFLSICNCQCIIVCKTMSSSFAILSFNSMIKSFLDNSFSNSFSYVLFSSIAILITCLNCDFVIVFDLPSFCGARRAFCFTASRFC